MTAITDKMPGRIALLPTDKHHRPVPWFVAFIDGVPDFRVIRPGGIQIALAAEEIARAIEASVCPPGEHCTDRFCRDCIRYQQARADAATARRIGGVR
jgi:hypothetical protein